MHKLNAYTGVDYLEFLLPLRFIGIRYATEWALRTCCYVHNIYRSSARGTCDTSVEGYVTDSR